MNKHVLTIGFTFLLAAATLVNAQSLGRLPGFVSGLDRGPRSSVTIESILVQVTNQSTVLILDGGEWYIGTNLSIPTNVSVVMAENAYFNIRTNRTLTIGGNFSAGVHEVFRGDGRAYIPAGYGGIGLYPFRVTSWGPTNDDVGMGYIQAWVTNYVGPLLNITNTFNTNFSYYYLDGTTQSLYGLTVRGPARFSNTVDIAGWLTTHGITNHGEIETDTLTVNSNLVVAPAAMSSAIDPIRWNIASNTPFFGFYAISPTNRAQVMPANAMTKMTNISVEVADSHGAYPTNGGFAFDRFIPTEPGMWSFTAAAVSRSRILHDQGSGIDQFLERGELWLIRNGATNAPAGAEIRTNAVMLARHVMKDSRERVVYTGSAMMRADGSNDYFELWFYNGSEGSGDIDTNGNAFFSATFEGVR